MWSTQFTEGTSATPAQLWRQYEDPLRWPEWDHDIKQVTIDGPLAVGARGRITPRGGPPAPFVVTRAVPQEGFTSVMRLPLARLTFDHGPLGSRRLAGRGHGRHRRCRRRAGSRAGPRLPQRVRTETDQRHAAMITSWGKPPPAGRCGRSGRDASGGPAVHADQLRGAPHAAQKSVAGRGSSTRPGSARLLSTRSWARDHVARYPYTAKTRRRQQMLIAWVSAPRLAARGARRVSSVMCRRVRGCRLSFGPGTTPRPTSSTASVSRDSHRPRVADCDSESWSASCRSRPSPQGWRYRSGAWPRHVGWRARGSCPPPGPTGSGLRPSRLPPCLP